jgi:hypothetical protein
VAEHCSVRLEARPHGAALVGPLARSLALAGAGAALAVVGARLAWPVAAAGALVLAFAALGAFRAVLAWDRTRLVVSRDQLVVVHGLVRRRVVAVDVDGAAIEIEQSIAGRLFGYATVVARDLEVPYVPDVPLLGRALASSSERDFLACDVAVSAARSRDVAGAGRSP